MNKNILIAVIVAIALATIGVGAFIMNSKKSATSITPKTEVENPAQQTQSVGELFQKAMTSGSLKCTFATESTNGTTYIKNGNINFTVTDGATKKVMHSIIKNKIMWTWNEGEAEGMTFDMSQMEAKVTPAQGATSPEDIQRQVEASQPNCTEESVSDNMFEVPKNVKFTDLSKMMKSVPQVTLPEGFEMPSGVPQY